MTTFYKADDVTLRLPSGLAQVLLCCGFVDFIHQAFPTLGLAFAGRVAGESRRVKECLVITGRS